MRSIHFTTTGCLGPCDLTNVVCILTTQKQIWLGGINENSQYEALLKWAKQSAEIGYLLDLPALFQNNVFERFKT